MIEQREADREIEMGEDAATTRKKSSITPKTVESLSDVIHLPRPSNDEHGLAAVPLIRHWLFAPDGSKLRHRDFYVHTEHRGRRLVQRIRIGDRFSEPGTGYGVLKARHQRMLFALQDLWQKQGGRLAIVDGARIGVVRGSSCDLEARLFGSHGGQQKRIVRALVQQLASIPVEITNYIGQDGEVHDMDITGLLDGATFCRTRHGGQRGAPWIEIYLSAIITRAFDAKSIKPVNLRVLNEFRSDLAALLYPKIDYYLAANPETEMRLDGLVAKLGLSGNQLHQLKYRMRKFAPVVAELNGKPLSKEGYIIEAKLVPTSDGLDYKLVARRKKLK